MDSTKTTGNVGLTALIIMLAIISLSWTVAAEGDPVKGEKVYKKCAVCHSLEQGKMMVGPSLAGIIGRKAGTLDGYAYSPAMKAYGVTWDDASLEAYLTNPRQVVPNSKMVFPGLSKPQDRTDLIAYLKQAAK